MRSFLTLAIVSLIAFTACHSEISKGKRGLVNEINQKVATIDHNHRLTIMDEDHVSSDSIYKIRGYYTDKELVKLVGILRTPHFERDDYFYFENNQPLFSGHMINFKDELLAEEFKYYNQNGIVEEALFWEDHYQPGKRFPHERFKEFEPDMDSLLQTEQNRLNFLKKMLEQRGHLVKQLNENLGAN